jgi:Fe-S cluster assembly iron-binding protein IscA
VIKVSDSAEEAIRKALEQHADGGTVRLYIAGIG